MLDKAEEELGEEKEAYFRVLSIENSVFILDFCQ
jgi:hypothetical protein